MEDKYIEALLQITGSERYAANWVIQHQGMHKGQAVSTLIGIIVGDPRHPATVEKNFMHEVQCGELILRVGTRYTDGDHEGNGLTGFITGEMTPARWRYTINKNGILVRNPHIGDYDRFEKH